MGRQLTDDERRRWRAGRHDWREEDWQDHCGDRDCSHPGNCCAAEIPTNDRVAALRARFERSILTVDGNVE